MKQLIVATYNIQSSLHPSQITKNILKMARKGVTVFCLQELVAYRDRPFIGDLLLKKLGKDWQAVYHLGQARSLLGMGNGIIWHTKTLTLKDHQKVLLPPSPPLAIHEKAFVWLAAGLTAPLRRRALIGRFRFNGKLVRITNLHLDFNGGTVQRVKQLKYLKNLLAHDNKNAREIICGDFNCLDLLNIGAEHRIYHQVLGDQYQDASERVGWTGDLNKIDSSQGMKLFARLIKIFRLQVRRKIDYVWVKNVTVEECYKLAWSGSDHYPVLASLRI
jgi:endonuclease/exonuclease/phosphatase family metal-dependent hydrolase